MQYKNLGKAGVKVSELSFGSWITFARSFDLFAVKRIMREAFSQGINFYDTAETYGNGKAEEMMGIALKDYRREDVVVSTKLFWGGDGPNDTGLFRKHLIEGAKNSLRRLGLEYVDILICHRPDPHTPIEETVRAMDHLIRQGHVLYWGTSEWTVEQITDAYKASDSCSCYPPVMEQVQYNMFHRQSVEVTLNPLVSKYGLGLVGWSPLNSGILSGKYIFGIPRDS